ncbi:acyltransferase family protein [Polyangium aurulentum]|uniref:acyltransferase family protein n=1 Tax=Polyangium aurulentum TaxID=2567896 RepID=UPI00146E3755|nr:acyltransferase [Polyangium aurulentum]UQA61768.1 acyltransferase [Polyangium aurulentum]
MTASAHPAHPAHRNPSAGKPLPQLDALRGVAILAVFAQHLGDRFLPLVRDAVERRAPAPIVPWIMTALHHAWWGVDLFFVLSGFSLALSAIRAGEQPVGPFLLRRAARILPGYYVALAVTLLFDRALVAAPAFPAALVSHLLLLQGYVSPGGIVIIGAAWSLTTEACFYLLFAWLARPLVLRGKRSHLCIGAAIVVSVWVLRAALHEAVLEPGTVTGLLEATQRRWIVSRLDQFVLGALAARAFVALEGSERAARLAPVGLAFSLPLLLIAFRLEGAYYVEPLGAWPYAILSLATAALVLSASLCRGRALALVAPRPLCAVGIVSYGVFLYHQLALALCDLGQGAPQTWMNFARTATVALALSVTAGYLSWRTIEQPALRRVRRSRQSAPSAVILGG